MLNIFKSVIDRDAIPSSIYRYDIDTFNDHMAQVTVFKFMLFRDLKN